MGGGQWSKEESLMHINTLELKAVHLVLLTFTKIFKNKSFHVQIDNMVAPTYLLKIGGITSQERLSLAKKLVLSVVESDHKYKRVFVVFSQHKGRSCIKPFSRQERMVALQGNILEHSPGTGAV